MSKIDIIIPIVLQRLMDQRNVPVTDHLAGYVRTKVKRGRYNHASEVVLRVAQRDELRGERRNTDSPGIRGANERVPA